MDDKDLLVFIPTYNESENVRLIIEGLRYNLGRVPILFCDDNSPDGTFELIQSIAREDGFIDVIHRESKLGIGSAYKVGIREASRSGYRRFVTVFDTRSGADRPSLPSFCPSLNPGPLLSDSDMASNRLATSGAIGSRRSLWLFLSSTSIRSVGYRPDKTGWSLSSRPRLARGARPRDRSHFGRNSR